MEVVFAMLFLGYFMYSGYIKYCLIAMTAQIALSFFIEKKQIWKIIIMIFITQGIVVPIADMTYNMINSIYRATSLEFLNVITSESFKFDMFYILILLGIIIIIGFFTYRSIEGKMNYKKWIALIIGYVINILIMTFMIFRFGIIAGGF
ncbi:MULTISPECIES: hypothetical protein [unclassified Clostridium]|uniref:hypothetical protein n=1 Tax=unclassified Clostridium TaxID=2614128 RepID=UPI00189AF30A|nr:MULTISPECIES: hypothetical protein [unclassified Clostridium]MCR1949829.1 hypothetical protein [Clostridium sp. DSM 100503]